MQSLTISDCRVRPTSQGDARLCAFATITLNGAFVVCDLKIIHGNEGIFVAMPSRRRRDGSFRDVAHPLNADVRAEIERAVLREYSRELARRGLKLPAPPAHVTLDEVAAEPATLPPLQASAGPPADLDEKDEKAAAIGDAPTPELADAAKGNGATKPEEAEGAPGEESGPRTSVENLKELCAHLAGSQRPIEEDLLEDSRRAERLLRANPHPAPGGHSLPQDDALLDDDLDL